MVAARRAASDMVSRRADARQKRAETTLTPDHEVSLYRFVYESQQAPHQSSQGSLCTMRDSFALARLILAHIVRPLVFAASAFIGVSVTYVLYILIHRRISAYRSALWNVPGPGGARWFKGNFSEVHETDSTRLQEEWVRKYGHVLKFQSFLWVRFSLLVILCPI